MPELGKYAFEVMLAYAGSLGLLLGLVALSVAQARRTKRLLDETERRTKDG